jgi:hypothetical protein
MSHCTVHNIYSGLTVLFDYQCYWCVYIRITGDRNDWNNHKVERIVG